MARVFVSYASVDHAVAAELHRLLTFSGRPGPVEAVAVSPDRRTVATGNGDGTAILWDVADRSQPARLAVLGSGGGPVYAVAFSHDGRVVATGSDDATAIVWDLGDITYLADHAVPVACAMAGPPSPTRNGRATSRRSRTSASAPEAGGLGSRHWAPAVHASLPSGPDAPFAMRAGKAAGTPAPILAGRWGAQPGWDPAGWRRPARPAVH